MNKTKCMSMMVTILENKPKNNHGNIHPMCLEHVITNKGRSMLVFLGARGRRGDTRKVLNALLKVKYSMPSTTWMVPLP